MNKPLNILKEVFPVIIMIGLIPFIANDYSLTVVYLIIIFVALMIKREPGDIKILIIGLLAMLISEHFFISTGIEKFTRDSLLGIMPIWLPLLWGYAFVVIKRSLRILDNSKITG